MDLWQSRFPPGYSYGRPPSFSRYHSGSTQKIYSHSQAQDQETIARLVQMFDSPAVRRALAAPPSPGTSPRMAPQKMMAHPDLKTAGRYASLKAFNDALPVALKASPAPAAHADSVGVTLTLDYLAELKAATQALLTARRQAAVQAALGLTNDISFR